VIAYVPAKLEMVAEVETIGADERLHGPSPSTNPSYETVSSGFGWCSSLDTEFALIASGAGVTLSSEAITFAPATVNE